MANFPTIHIRNATPREIAIFCRKFSEGMNELGLEYAELRFSKDARLADYVG